MDGKKSVMTKARKLTLTLCWSVVKVGRDDPRRVLHALKVGMALAIVSLLYLLEPLFVEVGENAMWAVMTVVVVLEFTAGATLCKGLNRGLGTLLAGSLAFFIEGMTAKSGTKARAVFVGVSVFFVGFATTYLRFFPYIKRNYDYGALIFLLTFNLITVSSFRVRNVTRIAMLRLYTIAIGSAICLFMTLLIFPNWSGAELHKSAMNKLEGLATSIETVVEEYFRDGEEDYDICSVEEEQSSSEDRMQEVYRGVLDCKSSDETLALFASWEPRHLKHCYRYPWQKYVKLGAVLRHFGYTAAALHDSLQSEIQAPRSVRSLFRDPCVKVAHEVSRVLLELSESLRNRRLCSPDELVDRLQQALRDLNDAIKAQPRQFFTSGIAQPPETDVLAYLNLSEKDAPPPPPPPPAKFVSAPLNSNSVKAEDLPTATAAERRKASRPAALSRLAMMSLEFSEALPFAAFTSYLVEMAARLERVVEEVEELGKAARFRSPPPPSRGEKLEI